MLWGRNRKERERRVREDKASLLESLEKENFILRNKLSHVQGSLMHIKSLYDQAKDQRDKARKVADQYFAIIERMINSLAAVELAKIKRDDPKGVEALSTDELVNLAIDAVRQRERVFRQQVVNLEDELTEAKDLIERLKEQVASFQDERLKEVNKMLSSASNVGNVSGAMVPEPARPSTTPKPDEAREKDQKAKTDSRREQAISSQSPETQTHAKSRQESSTTKEGTRAVPEPTSRKKSKLYVEDLSEVAGNLTDEHHTLIEIIGRTGVFRTTELKQDKRFLEQFNVNSNYFQQKLQELLRLGLITQTRVNIGARGHSYDVFRFTPKGAKVHEALYGRPPVETQLKSMLARHSTPEHALLVLETKLALERAGFEVDDSHEGNTQKLPSGAIIHFDLTARSGGDFRRIECERGIQSEQDIHKKLDKWFEADNSFYFVSPNQTSRETVKTKFYKWAARRGRAKLAERNLVVRFATLEGLKRNEPWEEVRFES